MIVFQNSVQICGEGTACVKISSWNNRKKTSFMSALGSTIRKVYGVGAESCVKLLKSVCASMYFHIYN